MERFYIDSCIYLNLWQKEGNEHFGVPYWKLALDFFERYNSSTIFYSNCILKELKYRLSKQEFCEKMLIFDKTNFTKVEIINTDLDRARLIESELNYEISFFDILHMLLAKKCDSILITRDKKFLLACKRYNICAGKPESFL